MKKPLIRIRNLSKTFTGRGGQQLQAVESVNFDIAPHTVVGLVGESGSGKTTLGKLLVGLHSKSAGEVYLGEEKLPQRYSNADFRRYSKRVQMIFQDPYASLNPRMTVEEILTEPLRLQGRGSRAQWRQRAADWLARVNLHSSHLSRYPHEFSGGQRQRIGIARALICEPEFVVCDEPVSALDVSVQAQVVNLLRELQRDLGLTLLFIAHDLSMVRYLCDEVVVMYLGVVVEQGASAALFAQPRHPYTRALLEANPLADPESERQRRHALLQGEIPSPLDVTPGCRFADRCPKVMARCRQQAPELRSDAQGRVACFLYE